MVLSIACCHLAVLYIDALLVDPHALVSDQPPPQPLAAAPNISWRTTAVRPHKLERMSLQAIEE